LTPAQYFASVLRDIGNQINPTLYLLKAVARLLQHVKRGTAVGRRRATGIAVPAPATE